MKIPPTLLTNLRQKLNWQSVTAIATVIPFLVSILIPREKLIEELQKFLAFNWINIVVISIITISMFLAMGLLDPTDEERETILEEFSEKELN